MLLTLYYVAATWLQSWRLSSMRAKIALVQKHNGSVLLYKESKEEVKEVEEGTSEATSTTTTTVSPKKGLPVQGIGTSKFIPDNKCQVGDILWLTATKKTVSLFPLPVVDISGWISVSGGQSSFPINLKGSLQAPLSDLNRLHLLLEADFCAFHRQVYHFHVEDFGVPKAWHADDLFSLLIETDEEHLTRLATCFMLNSLSIGHGLELIRIQSVDVTGRPCLLLNSDWEPISETAAKKIGMPRRGMTAAQWHNHVLMLRNFSQAANEAVKKKDPIPVSGQRGSVIVRGSSPVTLSSPTIIDMPLNGEKEVEEDCPCPPSPSVSLSVQRGSNSVEPSSTSASSFGSVPRLSTDTLIASPLSRRYGDRSGSLTSLGSLSTASVCSNIQPRIVIPHHSHSTLSKPPNVIVFSESCVSVESVKAALQTTLDTQGYTIYVLNLTQMLSTPWLNQAALVVISGDVPATLTPRLLSYVLQNNGRLFCLCSDLLGVFLPIFRTAEVRPDQLVTFSYSSWNHVSMMHHIFCYQPSPTPAKFSQDDHSRLGNNNISASGIPSSVEVLDNDKKPHKLDVKVLGAEETWQTPSLLVATAPGGGKIIFSQVHLEVDPLQYENDEIKLTELRSSDKARLEILSDILSKHLDLNCSVSRKDPIKYTPAYFLGVHESKLKLLENLKSSMKEENTLKIGDLVIKFCGKGITAPEASSTLLPVLMYACPDTFSTVVYFENLASETLGRLVIYCKVMTTSMALLSGPPLAHGLAIIPCIQTKGSGRGGNSWISPDGCAMFSLQLHIPLNSILGQHISLLQHLTALATVSAICSLPDLQGLDLGLKWPNDIYTSRLVKVGGAVINSTLQNGVALCNIGAGLNLNNKQPTTCVNDMITELNKKTGSKAPPLSFEKYFAITFTELERLINLVQNGQMDEVIALYYKYWLHSNAEVSVLTADGVSKQVTIVGIDNFGFLRVQDENNCEYTVQPDGNSFDMLQGLIAPKLML